MANNNVIHEKKKALLAYKDKILEEIKYYEKSIDDFRANHKNNSFYDDQNDSSDSENDFPVAIDTGPTIIQLKQQQAMLKTCLQATQELTGLMVLQSEVNVLVEDPKFEGEQPVTEAGTWREVTAECRIDLVPFTIMFFMHTPDRKFGPPSYRGLRVIPVKNAHEIELAKSVLHTLKLPSDATEVLKSYAAGYRSRRTTLARLANKYPNALFMEPHAEGGFVLKCADLLEVSWRLENKWSPVAPFHHRMKFDLEYMDESYIKIITQAHKQLLDPAIQTDERTLLLAKIISTCLEARGPIDPESDLESKTTERDNDIDPEKRDSEVMAPPKSLPKKIKQKTKDSLPSAGQKRSMDDDNGVEGAKKMRNDVPNDVPKKSVGDSDNVRKSKLNDVANEGGKKRKNNDVANSKKAETGNSEDKVVAKKPKTNYKLQNVKDTGITEVTSGNTKSKEIGNTEKTITKTKSKNKNVKDIGNTEGITSNNNSKNKKMIDAKNAEEVNTKTKSKNKNVKETENKENNAKTQNKIIKETVTVESNTKPKIKIVKDTVATQNKEYNNKTKENVTKNTANEKKTDFDNNVQEKASVKVKNKIVKEPSNIEIDKNSDTKPKNVTTKDDNIIEKEQNAKLKSIEKNKQKNVVNTKTNDKTDAIKNIEKVSSKEAEPPKSKTTEKKSNVANTKNTEPNPKSVKKTISTTVTKSKTTIEGKENNVTYTKNDEQAKKVSKPIKNIYINRPGSAGKVSTKNVTDKQTVNLKSKSDDQIVKKSTEKHANNNKNKDKISKISNTVSEKNVKDKLTTNPKATVAKVISNNIINKKNIKEPIKTLTSHKIASHRNALKVQNPQKAIKAGNTKVFNSGNPDKENGVKSKIPQKKLSLSTESAVKKNLLRISPRRVPSKFKSSSQENFKQKMMKTTYIPRLLKKPAPKTSQ